MGRGWSEWDRWNATVEDALTREQYRPADPPPPARRGTKLTRIEVDALERARRRRARDLAQERAELERLAPSPN